MRRFTLLTLLILTASNVAESAPRRRPAVPRPTLRVNSTHSPATPGWGLTHFATISDAVAAAAPLSRIELAAGTYREQVLVTKPLLLVGFNRENTIIDGAGAVPLTFRSVNSAVVSGVTLQGATSASAQAGFVVEDSSDLLVRDVALRDNALAAIYAQRTKRLTITESRITGNGVGGIDFRRCDDCAVEQSLISHPNPIQIRGSMRVRIEGNTIEAKAPGAAAAIFIHLGSNNAVVRDNVMTGDDNSSNPCTMIRVMRSNGTLIQNNTITKGRIGVWVALSDGTIIGDNSIEDYGDGDGVTLYLSNDSHILNNTIGSDVRRPYGGLLLLNSRRNVIRGNRLSDGSRGISLHHGSTQNRIEGNDVSNVRYGLVADQSSGNVFVGNNARGSVLPGFDDSTNIWSEGGKGNWWSDYAGTDANGDGVGDSVYLMGGGGEDQTPLAAPVVLTSAPVPSAATYAPSPDEFKGFSVSGSTQWKDESRSYTSVQVEEGGELVLDGVTLVLGESLNADMGECGLRVRSGGTLRVNRSNINGNGFYICVEKGGLAEIRNTELRHMGIWHSAFNSRGDNSVFENNVVIDSIHGIQFNADTSGGRIIGNRFVNVNGGIGLWGGGAEVRDNVIVNPITIGINVFTANYTPVGRNTIVGNEVTNAWHVALDVSEGSPREPQVIYGNSFTGHMDRPTIRGEYTVQWDDGAGRGNHWGASYLDEMPFAEPDLTRPGVWNTPYPLGSGVDRYPLICRAKATTLPPSAPALKAPTVGSILNGTNATFEWEAVPGASEYRLVVSTSNAFRSGIVFNRAGIEQTSRLVTGLNRGTTYHWRVNAKTSDCDGGWSQALSFATSP